MKKFLYSVLAIIFVFCLVGCGESNEVVLARKISKNTTKLMEAINNLEQVTQSDIAINEFEGIYQNANSTQTNPYATTKVSKIKQLFKRHNLVNIKNINETHTPKYMNETQSTKDINRNNNFDAQKSFYKSKYVSSTNNTESNNLDIFKNKIESLYNACQDCSFVNSQCLYIALL